MGGKCGTPRPSRGYARRISGRTINTVHGLSLNFQAVHIKFFGLPLTLELVMARSIWTISLHLLLFLNSWDVCSMRRSRLTGRPQAFLHCLQFGMVGFQGC